MRIVSTNPSRNYEIIGEVEASTEQEIKDAYRHHPDHAKVAVLIDAMEDRGIGVDFATSKDRSNS